MTGEHLGLGMPLPSTHRHMYTPWALRYVPFKNTPKEVRHVAGSCKRFSNIYKGVIRQTLITCRDEGLEEFLDALIQRDIAS